MRISRHRTLKRVVLALVYLAIAATLLECGKYGKAQSPDVVKRLIQARLDAFLDATRAKDISRYMSFVPPDWTLRDEKGALVGRDDLRRGVLEQWSIIDKTIAIEAYVDRLTVQQNNATVWTSQRWERLMHERTGPKLGDVLTTEKHEEHWRFTGGQWWCYEVKELGGEIFVNGQPYHD
jgi:hypothetical protein